MKKGLQIAGGIVGGLAGLVVLLMVVVLLIGGTITKNIVEKHSPDWVGRQIMLDAPHIDLFTGEVTLRNVRMLEQDGQTVFAQFDTLYAQISLLNLLSKEVWLDHIHLTGFDARIINRGTEFNFQDIVDHFSGREADDNENENENENANSWGIGLYDIQIHRSSVSYVDLPRHSRWGVENIDVDVPGFYLGRDQTEAGLSLDFPHKAGSLGLKAHYDMEKNTFGVDLDLDTVKVDLALPFVKDYAHVSRLGGRLSGCLRAKGALDNLNATGLAGELQLNETDIRDTLNNSLLTLHHAGVAIDTIDLGEMNIQVGRVEIDGLHTTFERWENHNTISDLMVEQAPDTAEMPVVEMQDSTATAPAPRKPLQLMVREVAIEDINLTYRDHTLSAPWAYDVRHLSVHAQDVTPDGENDVRLKAELPDGGSMMAQWKGGVRFKEDRERITLTVKNMQLRDFSPWCEAYTASPIEDGALSITSENHLNKGRLRGTNVLDIYNLKAGDKVLPSEAPYKAIPVKLGIELLSDLNHKIELKVPISGDINNPKFSYSRLIWKTIGNVLLKATASPWVAIGKALGMDKEDLSRLDIDPLQPDFTSEQYAKIDQLVNIMRQESELRLDMTQLFNLDDAITNQQLFDQKRAYYESLYGALQVPSLADIENIRAIKNTDKNYKAFLETHSEAANDSVARAEVMLLSDVRNRILLQYLTEQQALPTARVTVHTAGLDSLTTHRGKALFKVGE